MSNLIVLTPAQLLTFRWLLRQSRERAWAYAKKVSK